LQTPDPHIDQLLRTAIEQKRMLRLHYRNKVRIVEPHDYGEHNGVIKLLAYQFGGSSSGRLPNWRWMETDLISDVELLDRTFPGGRPTSSGKHHQWDRLFIRVTPADENRK
jgi:predicted DNA-binding transcriptional regulator YafY